MQGDKQSASTDKVNWALYILQPFSSELCP